MIRTCVKAIFIAGSSLFPTLATAEFNAFQDVLDICGGYSEFDIAERADLLLARGWTEHPNALTSSEAARLADISAHFETSDPTSTTGFGRVHTGRIGQLVSRTPDPDSVISFTRILQKGPENQSLVLLMYEYPSLSKCVFATDADAPHGAMVGGMAQFGKQFSLPFTDGVELKSDPIVDDGVGYQTSILAVEPKATEMSAFLGVQRPTSHGLITVTHPLNQ